MNHSNYPFYSKAKTDCFLYSRSRLVYTYHIVVNLHGQEMFFEPDEERNYRTVIEEKKMSKQVSLALLKAIAETIEALLK